MLCVLFYDQALLRIIENKIGIFLCPGICHLLEFLIGQLKCPDWTIEMTQPVVRNYYYYNHTVGFCKHIFETTNHSGYSVALSTSCLKVSTLM